ncbi:MAG: DNA polymerase III subunit beta [Clostridia bacterium]|nr:DNA polymerase III subunit beta [Clostridia bacterium]
MKITAQKSTLISAIMPALRAVAKTTTNPVLETFMLKAVREEAESSLIITGYDLEKGIKCVIPAIVKEEGSILISSSKLSAIINNLPEGDVNISCDQKLKVKITAGESIFEIAGIGTEVFPSLPELSGDRGFGISQGLLKRMTKQTAFAASQIENAGKPFMKGCYFSIRNGKIKIVGCDGYRLALREEHLDFEKADKELDFIVPAKTMINLADILSDSESPVNIQLSHKHIIFATEDFIFFSRLIEGEYMDYERAMPKSPSIFVKLALDDVIESINRVALIVDQRAKSPVCCYIEENVLKLTCTSVNGTIDEKIKAETSGGDLEIGFNHVFLKEAFERARDCGEEYVNIEFTSAQTGILIKPVGDSGFLYFILPVRLH